MYETVTQSSYTQVSYYAVQQQTLPPPLIPNPDYTHYNNSLTDPLIANYGPYPVNYDYPSNYIDPPNPPSNWVVKQAAPVKYSPAIQPLTKEATAPTSQNVPLYNNWVGQSSTANVIKRKSKRPKVIPKQTNTCQTVVCNLCKIECCTVQQYEKHLSGKKHNNHIKKMYAASIMPPACQASQSSSSGAGAPGGQNVPGIPSATTDLEEKKQKLLEVGATVQSVRVCTVCNVACNGEIAFADHLAGKKHLSQERAVGMRTNSNPNPVGASSTGINSHKNKTGKTNTMRHAWCEICKISCTSNEGLVVHRQGKKHKKNLEKLRSSISDTPTVASTTAVATAVDLSTTTANNTDPTKGSEPEPGILKKAGARLMEPKDLETKKRKMLECGVAADAVRMCTTCNVVCNSEEVLRFHLAGQKHASKVRKANT